MEGLGGLLVADADDVRRGGVDRDLPGLHRIGHFAHQVDHQQAVGQVGALDTDEVGELETALKAAIGDADMQEAVAVARFLFLLAANLQQILLGQATPEQGMQTATTAADTPSTMVMTLPFVDGDEGLWRRMWRRSCG